MSCSDMTNIGCVSMHIKVVMDVLRTHITASAALAKPGCGAIGNLAADGTISTALVAAGACEGK